MADEDEDYRRFLSAFYPFLLISTLAFQSITLYLVALFTPKNMKAMQYIFINTSVCQIFLTVLCFICQFRMISNEVPVYMRSYGLVRFLDAHIAYALHECLQFCIFASATAVVLTFYLKFRTITGTVLTNMDLLKTYIVFYLPVVVSAATEVYMVIHDALPAEIQQTYAELNSNVTVYSTIGTLKLTTVPSRINSVLMCGSGIFYPFIGIYLRKRILYIIDTALMNVSEIRKRQHKQFVLGLTIQAFLPFFCYTPLFSLYIFCVTTHTEILFQQYFMFIFPAIPSLLDPLVTCRFVTPYRRQIIKWTKITRAAKTAPVSLTLV